MKTTGIYKLSSTVNAKYYIGSAICIEKRWNDHQRFLRNNKHTNQKLQNHYNKYGKDSVTMSIVEVCSADNLLIREQYYLDTLNPLFNICKVAGSSIGRKYVMSDKGKESMRLMGLRKKGKPRGYAVTIYKGVSNKQSKKLLRTDPQGNSKVYDSLSSVNQDGFTFQNVCTAIKNSKLHKGYYWKYL